MCHCSAVVRLDAERYAAYCEHGNVSVTWFGCTFHIHSTDFAAVVGLFATGQGLHEHFILDRCQDKLAFWSRNACLLLSPKEARDLLALLRQAQDAVTALQARPSSLVSCNAKQATRLLN